MLCVKPYMVGPLEFGCGKCVNCLVNRKRLWTSRMMLEACSHADSSFVTLTYAVTPRDLNPEDMELFLKRLRKLFPPRSVRFFGV